MIVWQPIKMPAVDSQIIWYAGIVVGHENLLNALPDPENDDADWMWHRMGYLVPHIRSNDADSATIRDPATPRYITIDNKAKRKLVNEEMKVIFVFKNDVSSDDDVEVGLAARLLFLLH